MIVCIASDEACSFSSFVDFKLLDRVTNVFIKLCLTFSLYKKRNVMKST